LRKKKKFFNKKNKFKIYKDFKFKQKQKVADKSIELLINSMFSSPFTTKKRFYHVRNFFNESFSGKVSEFFFPIGLSFLSVKSSFLLILCFYYISNIAIFEEILYDPFNYYINYLFFLFDYPICSFFIISRDFRHIVYIFFLKIYKCVLPLIDYFFDSPTKFVTQYAFVS